MKRISENGSIRDLLKELEDLIYSIEYLKHEEDLNVEELKRIYDRVRRGRIDL